MNNQDKEVPARNEGPEANQLTKIPMKNHLRNMLRSMRRRNRDMKSGENPYRIYLEHQEVERLLQGM